MLSYLKACLNMHTLLSCGPGHFISGLNLYLLSYFEYPSSKALFDPFLLACAIIPKSHVLDLMFTIWSDPLSMSKLCVGTWNCIGLLYLTSRNVSMGKKISRSDADINCSSCSLCL